MPQLPGRRLLLPHRYRYEVLRDYPLLYWRLGELVPGTGTAADSSGNGRNGTYVASPTSVASLVLSTADPAVTFDGSTQWVTSTYNPFTGQRTFEGWANRTNSATGDALFGSATNANPVIFRCIAGSNDIGWTPDSSLVGLQTWTAAAPGTGVSFHWVLTYDNSTKVSELFINTVSQGTKTSSGAYNASPGNFRAAVRGTSGDPFLGALDEIAIYNGILSAARIADHFHAAGR